MLSLQGKVDKLKADCIGACIFALEIARDVLASLWCTTGKSMVFTIVVHIHSVVQQLFGSYRYVVLIIVLFSIVHSFLNLLRSMPFLDHVSRERCFAKIRWCSFTVM